MKNNLINCCFHLVAKLWYKVGFRNKIVSTEEISCKGCSPEKECSYNLIECIKK